MAKLTADNTPTVAINSETPISGGRWRILRFWNNKGLQNRTEFRRQTSVVAISKEAQDQLAQAQQKSTETQAKLDEMLQ